MERHREEQVATEAALRVVERRSVRTRQRNLTFLILLIAIWISRSFLTPVAWAAVLAVSLWPLYQRAAARAPKHRTLISLAFTLGTGLLVILPLTLAAVAAAQESQAALDWFAKAQHSGVAPPSWLANIPFVGPRVARSWYDAVGTPAAANHLLATVNAGAIFDWTRTIGAQVAHGSLLFLITLLALFGLLGRGEALARQSDLVSRRLLGNFGERFIERLVVAIRATVSGTILVAVGEGALIGVGYAVAGVPRPFLLAILTIAFAMVPFGAWLAFSIATLILLVQGHIIAAALLFGFSVLVMTVGDNIIQPAIIGGSVRLPFLLALVGTFGGLETFGLVGLFLGPVIMSALLLVWQQWMDTRTEQADAPAAASGS